MDATSKIMVRAMDARKASFAIMLEIQMTIMNSNALISLQTESIVSSLGNAQVGGALHSMTEKIFATSV